MYLACFHWNNVMAKITQQGKETADHFYAFRLLVYREGVRTFTIDLHYEMAKDAKNITLYKRVCPSAVTPFITIDNANSDG